MQTPTLHLNLGEDAEKNRNWQLIDQAITRVINRSGALVTGDLEVTGNLTVDGQSALSGAVQAGNTLTVPGLTPNYTTIQNDLSFAPGATFHPPAGSVSQATLAPKASVFTAASGVVALPPVGQMRIGIDDTVPPFLVCNVNLPADDNVRWTVVFAQVTMEVTCPANTFIWPGFNLNRGSSVMQQRGFAYQAPPSVAFGPVDIPFTMVRIAVPTDLSHTWSLWAQSGGGSGAAIVDITFGQMHAIQFA